MSLFQCEQCGCVENTALSCQGIGASEWVQEWFDWAGIEDRKGKLLCSNCAPPKYSSGRASGFGEWHGKFERRFLPLGQYRTCGLGNLEHKETGLPPEKYFSGPCSKNQTTGDTQ